jgi:broad specificity phosphatase PhoE
MRLILVRHGDAHAGLHGIIGGRHGCPGLTDLGRRQAEALRDHLAESGRLRPDVLIASVIPRAVETASIIAPAVGFGDVEVGQDCDLCEVHTGEADGLEWTEWSAKYGPLDMESEPDRIFAPGGDSWNSFHERVRATMQRLAAEHVDGTVVAVCHAGVIQASLRTLFDMPHPGTGARIQPTNTGLTEWDHDPALDRWTLRTFNDTRHLERLAGT